MKIIDLLRLYFNKHDESNITTGTPPTLTCYERLELKVFAKWADRVGYEVIRQVDGNGAAIFCAKCNGLIGAPEPCKHLNTYTNSGGWHCADCGAYRNG